MFRNRGRLLNLNAFYQIVDAIRSHPVERIHFIRNPSEARTYIRMRRSGRPTKLPRFTLTSRYTPWG